MSSHDVVCRFCLKNLNNLKNFEVEENMSKLFYDVTGIELVKDLSCPTVTCELCVRSLQYFAVLKNQLIENQCSLLSISSCANETPIKVQEPDIEFRNFSDSDEDPEPIAKKIKLEKAENEVWVPYDPTNSDSDLLEEIIPITDDQTCLYCHEKFPTNFALNLHVKKTHAVQDQILRCPYKNCQSFFKHISSLKQHEKMHQLEGSINCEICGRSFTTKDQLRSHKKYHQKPKFKCNKCDLSFYEEPKLRFHHLNKHQDARNHKCPMCDKTYLKNSHLIRHVKVTHEKQTINCSVPNCDRIYTRRERVIAHVYKQHPELTGEQIDLFVEVVKTTPYSYGIAHASTATVNFDEMNNFSDEKSYE